MEQPTTWLDYIIPAALFGSLFLALVVVPAWFWCLERADDAAIVGRRFRAWFRARLDAPIAPTPHQPAPRTAGAPRAHAENPIRTGAPAAPAPPDSAVRTTDRDALIPRIAGHKLARPGDGKTATARALGIARSGSSERYAAFSAAWDMLYPPAAEIERAEFVSERDSRIREEVAP